MQQWTLKVWRQTFLTFIIQKTRRFDSRLKSSSGKNNWTVKASNNYCPLLAKNNFLQLITKLSSRLMMLPWVRPTFANAFMSFHEQKWLAKCPDLFKPVLHRRYVDDTFLLFRSPEHIMPFLNYLNSQHNNIQFTHDSETNTTPLPFLDVFCEERKQPFRYKCLSQTYFYWFLFTLFCSFLPLHVENPHIY